LDEAALIFEANGLPHSFRKAIEIKKKYINRDIGDVSIKPIYNNLKFKDSNNIFP